MSEDSYNFIYSTPVFKKKSKGNDFRNVWMVIRGFYLCWYKEMDSKKPDGVWSLPLKRINLFKIDNREVF